MSPIFKFSVRRLTAALRPILRLLGMAASDSSTWPEFRACTNVMDWYDEIELVAGNQQAAIKRFKGGGMKVEEIRRYKEDSRSQHEYLVAKITPEGASPVFIRLERTKDHSHLADDSNQGSKSNNTVNDVAATFTQNLDAALAASPKPTRLSVENTVHAHAMSTAPFPPQDLNLASSTSPGTTGGGLGSDIEEHINIVTATVPSTSTPQDIQSSTSPSSSTYPPENHAIGPAGDNIKERNAIGRAASSAHSIATRAVVFAASVASTSSVASSDSISTISQLDLKRSRPAVDIIQCVSSWPDEKESNEIERAILQNTSFYDLVVAAATLHKSSPDYTLFKEQCYWFAGAIMRIIVECDGAAKYLYLPGGGTKEKALDVNKMLMKLYPEDGAGGTWNNLPVPHGTRYINDMKEQFETERTAYFKRITDRMHLEESNKEAQAKAVRLEAEKAAETERANAESERAERFEVEKRKAEAERAAETERANAEAARANETAAKLQERDEYVERLRAMLAQQGITDV